MDGGEPVLFSDFDFGSLDPKIESVVPVHTAASAVVEILQWAESAVDFAGAGARIAGLHCLLDPINAPFKSLADISVASGISRAALSHAITNLLDSHNIRLSFRLPGSRENCAAAQRRALENGTHVSLKSRKHDNVQSQGRSENGPES
jgi:hypothetical protein